MDKRINDIVLSAFKVLAASHKPILEAVIKNNYFISGCLVNGETALIIDLRKTYNPSDSWENFCADTLDSYNEFKKHECECGGAYHA